MHHAMYGFLLRPRWIAFHLLVVGAVGLMIVLGFWQLDRLDDRRAFNATVAERIEQPPVALTELVDSVGFVPAAAEWMTVTATGTYLDEQIVVFNRSQNGRAGDNVLTPLLLDDGRTVLVNRGFVPLGVEPPPPPATEVAVAGRVRPSQDRQRGGLTDPEAGRYTEIRRVDIDLLAPQLPGDVVPVYIDLVASEPAVTDADPAPVPPPELSEGNHLSYAFQWFIFAICVAVGWVLAIRRSLAGRRGSGLSEGARPAAVPPGSTTPVDAASDPTLR